MKVSLTPEVEQLIQEKINSGQYTSVSEMIAEGLRLLDERDKLRAARFAELKQKIREGIEAADRGELIDGEEVFAEIEEDIRRAEARMQEKEEVS
ncbi:type II toxin-antitoxin system ParD family antitoxin [Iningainema tapete]|uniref:Type II toxin-antitoxin system ParD family antitoxin n=1 Tax=Iningainema tapete BLCC-T55 TaxID=2748662 RepID=A0A8J6XG33_9CYAN|nr:type II toxin-antitoxin system ParD family antitoxin [Iningainema tapete]MBD2773498.1 type II toxin-antitoxin system ParD family antitoxin [Iningainema tapete BLCC-T55]